MSKGLGALQQRIIGELRRTPAEFLPWTTLKTRFQVEAEQHSLHRAVRALRKRGLIFEGHVGGRRYVALTVLADAESLALYEAAHAQLKAVARARGVPVPPLTDPTSPERELHPPGHEVDA